MPSGVAPVSAGKLGCAPRCDGPMRLAALMQNHSARRPRDDADRAVGVGVGFGERPVSDRGARSGRPLRRTHARSGPTTRYRACCRQPGSDAAGSHLPPPLRGHARPRLCARSTKPSRFLAGDLYTDASGANSGERLRSDPAAGRSGLSRWDGFRFASPWFLVIRRPAYDAAPSRSSVVDNRLLTVGRWFRIRPGAKIPFIGVRHCPPNNLLSLIIRLPGVHLWPYDTFGRSNRCFRWYNYCTNRMVPFAPG